MQIKNYMNDGANFQAQCVLAYLRGFTIEKSWDKDNKYYQAEINVSRWENCREQGYVFMMHNKKRKQLNIAVFEHRNSDSICAIKWIQNTINAPTIENANFNGECYRDKWDVSREVNYMDILEIGDWIKIQFESHWEK